ncbi:MAG: phosphate uptake regulator PhoU [Peptococcaceae bacterium]|jgi:phosphate transport system protein|nr:phosphate uptake regulator PhoU [Peptococcaceae bacterium]
MRVSGFDRVLLQLKTLILELATAVQDLLNESIHSIETAERREDWRTLDRAIGNQKSLIINRIFEIMSLRQLSDQDVRWLMNSQQIAHELERISGYACDLAEISQYLTVRDWPPSVREMIKALTEMLDDVVAVLQGEARELQDIEARDDTLDQGLAYMLQSMRGQPAEDHSCPTVGTDAALSGVLAFTLERAGDHVVNIAQALRRLE